MKGLIKIVSVFILMIFITQNTVSVFAAISEKSPYTGYVYTHPSKFDSYQRINGIDVSEHNGTVDFNKVKADGIDFVFVRVGFTGYTKARFSLNYDKNYTVNINNALKAGLKVGVYWYSQALNAGEARQEAQKTLDAIKGFDISMPVVMDYEFADTSAGRLDSAGLSKSQMTDNALAFLNEVEAAGYDPCLYANAGFLTYNLNAADISGNYKIWLAHYVTGTSYAGDFDIWQYSQNGKVDGINGSVDVNFWYYNGTVNRLDDMVYTGQPLTPQPVVEDNGTVLEKDRDYTLTYKNNTEVGTAYITAQGINKYLGKKYEFKFLIKPDKARVITLKERKTTSLKFAWDAVKGAQVYYVKIKNNITGADLSRQVTANSITITGLTPGNSYDVSMKAGRRDSAGNIIYGNYTPVNTKHTVSDAVTGLRISSTGKTALTLTWNKKAGAAGYRIYRYYPSTKKYSVVADVNGYNKNSYTVKGLNAGETVYFRVSAFTVDSQKKIGYKSAQLTAGTRPQTITVRSVSSPSSKKAALLWYRVNGSGYQIQWSTTSNFSSNKKSVTLAQSKNRYTITTYYGNKTYYVRMRSFRKVDGKTIYGYWSATQVIKVK